MLDVSSAMGVNMSTLTLGLSVPLLASRLAGCVTYTQVPVRDGALPADAIEVGDTVRARERGGGTTEFEVTGIEPGALIGATQRAELAGLSYLALASRKRSLWIALGVVGGAWLLYEQNNDCDPGPGALSCN